MQIEFDPAKDAINRAKHGIGLASAAELDFNRALVFEDDRDDGGEARFIGYAPPNGRLHAYGYTWRGGVLRIIGLRKANLRERKRYDQLA